MTAPKNALILIGSPRLKKSTSARLGAVLEENLEKQGLKVSTLFVRKVFASPQQTEDFLAQIEASDLLVLISPLYVDSLPAPVTRLLELVAQNRKNREATTPKLFAAIINCGLPDPGQNTNALNICRIFARHSGLVWAGGLSLGSGEIIGGRPLSKAPPGVGRIKKALEIAAGFLAKGQSIPNRAQQLLEKPLAPWPIYLWMGSIWFYRAARKNKATSKMHDKPYCRAAPGRR
ncbi:MAG: NAD(P)H-dependent oxidoreductase [Desulfatibacillaceae bacterium]|nr:NAD(P)H-dependent oxidoreductase [Desulfatibacillaceae bacterium]